MITISKDKRYLTERGKGGEQKPFFWLGDTAWLLLSKLTLDEIREYFKDRAGKHFNVIQAVLVYATCEKDAEGGSLPMEYSRECNAVVDGNFSDIDLESGYWNKVDKIVEMAGEYGLYMGLLPVWGSMVKKGYLTMDNVQSYGEFLARRYGEYDNIIWVLGGDVRGNVGYDIWNKLGSTIKSISPHQFMTFHPFGRTSSDMWFSEAEWIDMHMFQSGHRRYDQKFLKGWDENKVSEDFYGEDSWRYVQRALERDIVKPIVDGEPSYEEIPQGLHDLNEPYWQAKDVRRYAYWSVLAGACGHTYGHNAIMQFYTESDKKAGYGVKEYWAEALHAKGSCQMKYLYELMAQFDLTSSESCDEALLDGQQPQYNRIACRQGKNFALFYTYTGKPFKIRRDKLGFLPAEWTFFDPASGIYHSEANIRLKQGIAEIIPPKKQDEWNDWVLIIR